MITLFVTLALVGALAGVIAGLFGVGGGIVLVPAFLYVFLAAGYAHDQLTQIAVATSLATIVFTSLRSVMAHNKKGAVDWDILRSWAAPVVIGAIIGGVTATMISARALLVIFAILAILVSAIMGLGVGRGQVADHMPTGPQKWGYGGGIGFFSTLMGIGGGSFAVPLQVLHGVSVHRAVATASGFGGLIALPAALTFALRSADPLNLPPYTIGYVNIPAFMIVVFATFLTAPMGANLAHRLDANKLRKYFAFFIFLVALNMLRKAIF